MGMHKDTIKPGKYLVIIEENEEKLYDRASLELQLMEICHLRCPLQGYVELKADDMVK
jgi:hypothetical protein